MDLLRIRIKSEKDIQYASQWIAAACIVHNVAMDMDDQAAYRIPIPREESGEPPLVEEPYFEEEGEERRRHLLEELQMRSLMN